MARLLVPLSRSPPVAALTWSTPNRMKVHDDELGKDDLAAWACFRLDRLQQGYRLVHLMDARGVESDGFLLVKITKSLT